jgi:methylenetetrahydrofolate dehydrogenase (NADP+) / methenyltetrahydrofolate cyclohydrolase
MPAIILDGKSKADEIKRALGQDINTIKSVSGNIPRLAALQVGDDHSFSVYVNSQQRIASQIGIDYRLVKLPSDCAEKCLIDNIISLNNDKDISGIILQSPLPEGFDMVKVSAFISSDKDVEGVNPENKGKLLLNSYKVVPPTASAVMELIGLTGVNLNGKEVVIIGHSGIVGKPLAMLLLDRLCTVTVCHIGTYERGNLQGHISRAEILVVSAGKPGLVKGEWIKKNAIVIDVGINKVKDRIVGDVEFDKAFLRASYISPVPGGVGPLTAAILMRNCFQLFKNQRKAV